MRYSNVGAWERPLRRAKRPVGRNGMGERYYPSTRLVRMGPDLPAWLRRGAPLHRGVGAAAVSMANDAEGQGAEVSGACVRPGAAHARTPDASNRCVQRAEGQRIEKLTSSTLLVLAGMVHHSRCHPLAPLRTATARSGKVASATLGHLLSPNSSLTCQAAVRGARAALVAIINGVGLPAGNAFAWPFGRRCRCSTRYLLVTSCGPGPGVVFTDDAVEIPSLPSSPLPSFNLRTHIQSRTPSTSHITSSFRTTNTFYSHSTQTTALADTPQNSSTSHQSDSKEPSPPAQLLSPPETKGSSDTPSTISTNSQTHQSNSETETMGARENRADSAVSTSDPSQTVRMAAQQSKPKGKPVIHQHSGQADKDFTSTQVQNGNVYR
ncbi:hypothetical protein Q7P37_007126 [Cladosporium fusiforme]